MNPKYKVGDYVEFIYLYFIGAAPDMRIGKITIVHSGPLGYIYRIGISGVEDSGVGDCVRFEGGITRKLTNEQALIWLLEN